jgi:Ca2+-binding RTX toxin-like protein
VANPPYYVSGLLPPDQYRWNNNAPGTPLSLTYGFMTTAPSYADPSNIGWIGNEFGSFQAFYALQRQAVDRAIQNYEQVCNVDFSFLANGDAAQVRFGNADLGDFAAAHSYLPERSSNWEGEGDVWFHVGETYLHDPWAGSYAYMVVLHEIGHTLGLKHPHDPDGLTSPATLLPEEDNRQYTVMSYNPHPNYLNPPLEPSSLQLYDIAALQYLYGANMSTRNGDSVYAWNPNAQFITCIWDGGGTDTIDASNQARRSIINLNAGTFSSVGWNDGSDAVNNLSIAYNCVIENAIGGSGSDTLIGNDYSNRLEGGFGNDALYGGSGTDTLIGGAGADHLDGGWALNDMASYAASNAGVTINLVAGSGLGGDAHGDTLVNIEEVTGSNYNDVLIGGGSAGVFYGLGGNDYLDGASDMRGAAGDDIYMIRNATDIVRELAGEGFDEARVIANQATISGAVEWIVFIGSGNLHLTAGDFASTIIAGSGNDMLSGGGGNDTLHGGAGNDTALYGGNRSDYQVTKGAGQITVVDLRGGSATDGTDTLFGIEFLQFNDTTILVNNAPVVAVVNHLATPRGTVSLAASALVNASDGDGDALTYQFWDESAGGGYFTVNGAQQTANTAITVAAANIGTASYRVGTTTDTLWVRASDGYMWTDWTSFLVAPPSNQVPVVTGVNQTPAHGTTSLAAGSLLSFSDGDSDPVVAYQFWDESAGGGHFTVNGAQQGDNTAITVAANIGSASYVLGSTTDTLWVRASDGMAWSAWTAVTVLPPQNHAPNLAVSDKASPVHGTTSHAASSLVNATDADSDPITYQFWDQDAGGGYFTVNGAQQSANTAITVTAANIGTAGYRLGSATDTLWVRASDGFVWTDWKSFTVAPALNQAPIVAGVNKTPGLGTTSLAASSLVNASDGDGDTLTYQFWDESAGGGYFTVNGTPQSDNTAITVTAANIGTASYQLGTTTDTLWVRASDGTAWSDWKSLTVAAPQNHAPVVTGTNRQAITNASLAVTALFTAMDPNDGEQVTKYQFWDSAAGGGRFEISGAAQGDNVAIEVMTNQLAAASFVTGSAGGTDVLWARAFDGTAWGEWKSSTVTTLAPS